MHSRYAFAEMQYIDFSQLLVTKSHQSARFVAVKVVLILTPCTLASDKYFLLVQALKFPINLVIRIQKVAPMSGDDSALMHIDFIIACS